MKGIAFNQQLIIGIIVGLVLGLIITPVLFGTNTNTCSQSNTVACLRQSYDQMRQQFAGHSQDWVYYGQNPKYVSAWDAATAMSAVIKSETDRWPVFSEQRCRS